LINLAGVKQRDLLLDPFVGVGAVISEAILNGINVYGADISKGVIEDAGRNISWLRENYPVSSRITLKQMDSKKVPDMQWAGIATETPLGKLLKKKPKDSEAEKIILNFEAFIIPILRRLKKTKKSTAKIAITFPKIRNFHVNVKKISEKCDLKIVAGPIEESRPDQFIGRDIIVFV
jgi:tRNA G10  N-methylase Trm11